MRRAPATVALVFVCLTAVACGTSRGPVDRSVDAAHATNRTIGESVDSVTSNPAPRNVVVDALTFPFRLVGRVGEALFGP